MAAAVDVALSSGSSGDDAAPPLVNPILRGLKAAYDAIERYTMHGKHGFRPYAFWLTVFCCVAGVLNSTLTSVYYTRFHLPLLGPALPSWTFGIVPDSPQTFDAALAAVGLGVALIPSVFRLWLFQDRSDRELRRLDWIMTMLISHNMLWFSLRASDLLPFNASVMASVRESLSYAMVANLYLAIARSRDRIVFGLGQFLNVVLLVGLVDRFIMVFDLNQPSFGVFISPVVRTDQTARYLVYLVLCNAVFVCLSWRTKNIEGNDRFSRILTTFVGLFYPVLFILVVVLRVEYYPREYLTPGNTVFFTEPFTGVATAVAYGVIPQLIYLAKQRALDTLKRLRGQVVALEHQNATSTAVARAQTEFTRYIFHEVRGPLNNLRLSLNLLASSPSVRDNDDALAMLTLMDESTGIVQRITNDVLFVAKLESSSFPIIYAPFLLREMLTAAAQQELINAQHRGAQLVVEIAPDLPSVLLGDANRIQQIIMNFLNNAIKFVDAGSGRITLRVTALSTTFFKAPTRAASEDPTSGTGSAQAPLPTLAATDAPDVTDSFFSGLFHRLNRQRPRSQEPGRVPSTDPAPVSTLPGATALQGAPRNAQLVPIRASSLASVANDATMTTALARGFVSRQDSISTQAQVSTLSWMDTRGLSAHASAGSTGFAAMRSTPPLAANASPPVASDPLVAPATSIHMGSFAESVVVVSNDDWLPRERLLPFEQMAPCSYMFDLPGYPDGDGPMPTPEVVTVRVEVIDNGCGIGPEGQARLFQPYMQVSSSIRHTTSGTGLGLYISSRLAKQMGGDLGVRSAVGEGSTFYADIPLRVMRTRGPFSLTLPSNESGPSVTRSGLSASRRVHAVEPAAEHAPAPTASPSDGSRPLAFPVTADSVVISVDGVGQSARAQAVTRTPNAPVVLAPVHILLTDDASSQRRLLRQVLLRRFPNAVVSEAADGAEASAVIASAKEAGSPLFTAGVVCMDKEMPECDGFEATQRIRAMGFEGLVLGVTGNALAADTGAFLEFGADAVILKPVSVNVLFESIRQFVEDGRRAIVLP